VWAGGCVPEALRASGPLPLCWLLVAADDPGRSWDWGHGNSTVLYFSPCVSVHAFLFPRYQLLGQGSAPPGVT